MSKVMISLPDDLLARLDAEAARRLTTRSGLLASAARHELERADLHLVDEAVARSRARFAGAAHFESADLVRAERDAHS
jgi:metal-responsive CopG/Arc/MetJ family transcriptional regulator